MTRGFEVVSAFAGQDIHLPVRKTEKSAGYDIESAADVDLLPGKVTVIPTGGQESISASIFVPVWESNMVLCWRTVPESLTRIITIIRIMKAILW